MLRIIEEPRIVWKNGNNQLQIKCSDNNTYNITELAKKRNMHRSTLGHRLATLGWEDPRVLEPVKKAQSQRSADLVNLSDTKSRKRLSEIKGPTDHEKELWGNRSY